MPEQIQSEGVSAEEIPVYLDMQTHCGVSGLCLTSVWFALAHRSEIINLLSLADSDIRVLASIMGAFLFAAYLPTYARKFLREGATGKARSVLRACSMLCVLAFTILLWFTGGASSPFVALFVMTYTLTLSKVKTRSGPVVVPALFLTAFAFASLGARVYPAFSDEVLDKIATSQLNYWALFLGGVVSLVIPVVSSLLIAHKKHHQD